MACRPSFQISTMFRDYSASDVLFPHPLYGRMRWVSVVAPDLSWPQCQDLLVAAHQLRELRPDSW